MFTSYEESVHYHADAEGRLSRHIIKQLFHQHSSSFKDYEAWDKVNDDNWDMADLVLEWLGY